MSDYHEFYKKVKITIEDLKTFPQFTNKTNDELDSIVDALYDIAILSQKIMMNNE